MSERETADAFPARPAKNRLSATLTLPEATLPRTGRTTRRTEPTDRPGLATSAPWIIVVGASGSDGLQQLTGLVQAFPPDLAAAVLVVLHRPLERQSYLPDILQRRSRMGVRVPLAGEPLQSGVCYVGTPSDHLTVGPGDTAMLAPDHLYRSSNVDLLFRSAATWAGPRTIGVVLAGALSDGAAGLAAIKAAGGRAMVVDSGWIEREGMPRAAWLAVPGADKVGTVEELAEAIVALVGVMPTCGGLPC
jgi:chemotaxis response regulator CheB